MTKPNLDELQALCDAATPSKNEFDILLGEKLIREALPALIARVRELEKENAELLTRLELVNERDKP